METSGFSREGGHRGQIKDGSRHRGRIIPLNPRAVTVLTHWRDLFPSSQPEHYVFPHEMYGPAGNDRKQCAYEIIPTEPMHPWKVAWESARRAAGVSCGFHDLRHTFI